MAIVWFEGLETGDDDGFVTVSGGAMETAVTLRSVYAWRANVSAATAYLEMGPTRDPWWGQSEADGWLMFHFYITTMPGAGQDYYLMKNIVTTLRRQIRIDGDDSKIYGQDEGGSWAAAAGTVEAGKWYTMSIKVFDNTQLRWIVREQGTGIEVIDHSTSDGTVDRTWAQIQIGPGTTSTGNIVFDNFVFDGVNDPYAALGNDYTIEALLPDGVGTDDDWTGAYTDVDDLPHDSTTTERTETAAQNFTQHCQDASALSYSINSIISVMSYAYAITNLTSSSYNLYCRMREGGSAVNSGNYTIGDSGPTTYTRGFAFVRNTSPAGSGWTAAILDTIQTGAGRSGSGVARTCSVTAVSLHVLYKVRPSEGQIIWMWFQRIQELLWPKRKDIIPVPNWPGPVPVRFPIPKEAEVGVQI